MVLVEEGDARARRVVEQYSGRERAAVVEDPDLVAVGELADAGVVRMQMDHRRPHAALVELDRAECGVQEEPAGGCH